MGLDGWIGWKSPGGGMYRAPYGANNVEYKYEDCNDEERENILMMTMCKKDQSVVV